MPLALKCACLHSVQRRQLAWHSATPHLYQENVSTLSTWTFSSILLADNYQTHSFSSGSLQHSRITFDHLVPSPLRCLTNTSNSVISKARMRAALQQEECRHWDTHVKEESRIHVTLKPQALIVYPAKFMFIFFYPASHILPGAQGTVTILN